MIKIFTPYKDRDFEIEVKTNFVNVEFYYNYIEFTKTVHQLTKGHQVFIYFYGDNQKNELIELVSNDLRIDLKQIAFVFLKKVKR